MASNYASVLEQLRNAGLDVTTLQVGTARPVRCRIEGDREKRGWYSLHELMTRSGEVILVGSYGVWRGDDNNAQKIAIEKRDELTADQRDSLRRRMAEDRKRAEQERKASAERAAQLAAKAWARCAPTGASAYLDAKGVQAHGLRFSPSGALAIPMMDVAGKIHGLQIIRDQAAARASRKLAKEFWPTGVAKKGHFHLLGMPTQGSPLLVAEGYATAATLHEATGLPVAVAFDAGNIAPVAAALHRRYKLARILVCADDDALHACLGCQAPVFLDEAPTDCANCGKPHGRSNAGVMAASATALEVGGAWVVPQFADPDARREAFTGKRRKLTDFNDLHALEGLPTVRIQIEARLSALGWDRARPRAANNNNAGQGAAEEKLRPIQSLDELLERFALVYGQGGTVFDRQEHRLVSLSDMRDACTAKEIHRAWQEHPDRDIVRVEQVVFEPGLPTDDDEICNLWSGWPTVPRAGVCSKQLELLRHMCVGERDSEALYQWVLRWVAYPLQHHGAKMKTTVVIHSKQGTGKNLFWESVMAVYGRYGRMVDQNAIEDRFNDWASRKLFLIADEVLARSEIYHVKNKLKSFITGDWIRINPKNMAAYDERNHVNLVFLSNESMPVVLEEDDRRHAVIWIPENLPESFYREVAAEIGAGGTAALHDYLLHLPLGDFNPHTKPPMTEAKAELIELGMDSTSRFYKALYDGEVRRGRDEVPCGPALSEDVYEVYRLWCSRNGYKNVAPINKLVNVLKRRHGIASGRKRYLLGQTTYGPHQVLLLGGLEAEPGAPESHWLGAWVQRFRDGLDAYKGESRP